MQTFNKKGKKTKKVEKYLMKDVDPLINSILEADKRLTEEKICLELEYNEGYISQLRSREKTTGEPQVSMKFFNQLKTLHNATIHPARKQEGTSEGGSLSEALEIIKQQNAFLQKLIDTNLAALSADVNNNAAAIRAEMRGYAHRLILKEVNYDDDEFLKAKAEADKIYLLSLKQLLGDNKPGAGK
jgi:hypothetical protein